MGSLSPRRPTTVADDRVELERLAARLRLGGGGADAGLENMRVAIGYRLAKKQILVDAMAALG